MSRRDIPAGGGNKWCWRNGAGRQPFLRGPICHEHVPYIGSGAKQLSYFFSGCFIVDTARHRAWTGRQDMLYEARDSAAMVAAGETARRRWPWLVDRLVAISW